MTFDHSSLNPTNTDHSWHSSPPLTLTRSLILILQISGFLAIVHFLAWTQQPSNPLWVALTWYSWFWIAGCTGIGVWLGTKIPGIAFWLITASVCLAFGLAHWSQWTVAGVSLPWLLSAAYLCGPAILIFLEKTKSALLRAARLEDSWNKRVDPNSLKKIIKNPQRLSVEPREEILTTMFVNLSDFYLIAEKQSVQKAFELLQLISQEITETVHRHGGIVNNTSGSGLFCVFGYKYDGSRSKQDHAHQAVLCAIEIQRNTLKRNLDAIAMNQPVCPLRIGINTSTVFIGDLGDNKVIDLKLIGQGVNFTKLLQSACESYCIMLGALTKDMLLDLKDSKIKLTKRFIQPKHFNLYCEAHECDPFPSDPQKIRAINAHRKLLGLERQQQRWPLPPGVSINVFQPDEAEPIGQLLNFSVNGLGLVFNQYLGKGTKINLVLDTKSGNLKHSLNSLGMLPIIGEVRWGNPKNDSEFLLGLEIINLTPQQRKALVELLRTCVKHQMPEVVNE